MKIAYYTFIQSATNLLENLNNNIIKSADFKADLNNTKIYLKNKLASALKEKSKSATTYKTTLKFNLLND